MIDFNMSDNVKRIKELVSLLNQASQVYYAEDREMISNYEYDGLYDELVRLEQETGMILSNSPTVKVGYEAVDFLEKQTHEQPMLSLDKTKEPTALESWLGKEEGLLSYKLDGLTVVLTYDNGKLQQAVTRGNGEVGEVITNNAKVFTNLPQTIPYEGRLILRGEAVISYSDFLKINEQIDEESEKYKNPRNLCSGSVRQLNNSVTKERNVSFYAFALVQLEESDKKEFREEEFEWLAKMGFEVVPYYKVNHETILQRIEMFAKEVVDYNIPSDGLVLCYNNIAYGNSLGRTSKFPRDAIAFKWQDEIRSTKLVEIEWSPSRTGLINPVAIFEPVELEGTTVTRASVHNVSILEQLALGIGDTIEVYKANMIIPQIAQNLTRSNTVIVPESCPVCGESTTIQRVNEVASLYCTNPECPIKQIKSFAHFVSRNALNMDGLSEATLSKLMEKGMIGTYADLFHLEDYKDTITSMEGFGEKSYENLVQSIEQARKVSFAKLIYSLGIPNVGTSNAKMLGKFLGYSIERLLAASPEELGEIEGVGEVIASSIVGYFSDEKKKLEFEKLLVELELEQEIVLDSPQVLSGKVFVITGSLNHYENREALKEEIERLGGKVTGSVTKKTSYLINNDSESTSSKNKKARELGVEILTEEAYGLLIEG